MLNFEKSVTGLWVAWRSPYDLT